MEIPALISCNPCSNTTKDLDVLGVARIAQQMREGCKQGSAAAQAANASNLTNAKNLAQVLTGAQTS